MFYRRSFLYRLLDSFFRHRWLFLISTLCVIAVVVGYAATRKSSYSVGYTILVDSRTVSNPLSQGQSQDNWSALMNTTNHLQSLLETREFIKSALTNPDGSGIGLNHPINLDDPDALDTLRKSITVNTLGSDSFSVQVVNPDAQDSDLICKSIIQTFVDRTAEENSALYSEQVAFVGSQVDIYRKKLADAENAYTEFKAKNINNLPSQQDAIEQNVTTYQTDIQDLQTQLAVSQIKIPFLKKQLSQTPEKIVASQTMGDSPLDAKLKTMQAELTEDLAVKQMKENHPAVVALKQEMTRLEQQIQLGRASHSNVTSGVTATDMQPNPAFEALQSEFVDAQSQVQETQQKLAYEKVLLQRSQASAQAIPYAEREAANLQRDYEGNKATYATLTVKLDEATLSEQLNLKQQRAAFTVLLTSPPQSLQSAKKTALLLIAGLFVALIVGASLVVGSEWLDQSLRDPVDAARLLGLPVLAVLPEAGMLEYGPSKKRLNGGTSARWLKGGLRALPGGGAAGSSAVTAAAEQTDKDEDTTKKNGRGRFPIGGFPNPSSAEEATG